MTPPPMSIVVTSPRLRPSSSPMAIQSPSMPALILQNSKRPIWASQSALSWLSSPISLHMGISFFLLRSYVLGLWRLVMMPAFACSTAVTLGLALPLPLFDFLLRLGASILLLSELPFWWLMPLRALALSFRLSKNSIVLAILLPRLPPGVQIRLVLKPHPSASTLGPLLLGGTLIPTLPPIVGLPGVICSPLPLGGLHTTLSLQSIVGGRAITSRWMGGGLHSPFHTQVIMVGLLLPLLIARFLLLVCLPTSTAMRLFPGTMALGGLPMRLHWWRLCLGLPLCHCIL
jgi:hypothetical protein